jgi:hypothetical protein
MTPGSAKLGSVIGVLASRRGGHHDFDAAMVGDRATFAEPHQFWRIDYVVVNGQVVVEHGMQHPHCQGKS